MAVTNIGIVSVPITAPDRAIAFYVGVLGFELIDDAPMGPTMRWVTVAPKGGETHLSLVTWFPTMVPGSMKGLLFNSDALDEDISIAGLLEGVGDQSAGSKTFAA